MRVCPECFRLYGPDQGPCPKDGTETVHHTEVLIGLNLGPYIVRSQISEGGMGVVYAGEHPTLGRRVALKVLRPELSLRDDIVERFTQEARAVNTIGNRNIVNIYDFGRTPYGSFYIVMEYLDGATVRRLLDTSGPQPIERVRFVVDQVGEALGAAHEKGFIHRDVKPENIMLCSRGGHEFVKLLDFGIAKLQSAHRHTATGSAMGTPQYMPPEQLEDAHLDQRTDIYALGAVTYEMLTGRVPYPGTSHAQVRQLQVTQAPPPPSVCRRDIRLARSVDAAVLRALNLSPADRYDSAADLVAAFQRGYDDTIAERGLAPRPGARSRLRFWLLSLLLGAVVAAGGVTAVLLLTAKPKHGSGSGSGSAAASGTGSAGSARGSGSAGQPLTLDKARAIARKRVDAALAGSSRLQRKVLPLVGEAGVRSLAPKIYAALQRAPLRDKAVAALVALGHHTDADRAQLRLAIATVTNEGEKANLAKALAAVGDVRAGRRLARALLAHTTNVRTRLECTIALVNCGAGKRDALALARLVKTASGTKRIEMLGALARSRYRKEARRARATLSHAARRGSDWAQRFAAASALVGVDDATARAVLRSAMDATQPADVRVDAAVKLARLLEDALAAPVLIDSLARADEARGKKAAVGLGRLLARGKLTGKTLQAARAALIRTMQKGEGDAKLAAAVALID